MSSLTPGQPVAGRGDKAQGGEGCAPAAAVSNPGGVSPQLPQNGEGAGAPNHGTFRDPGGALDSAGGCREGPRRPPAEPLDPDFTSPPLSLHTPSSSPSSNQGR